MFSEAMGMWFLAIGIVSSLVVFAVDRYIQRSRTPVWVKNGVYGVPVTICIVVIAFTRSLGLGAFVGLCCAAAIIGAETRSKGAASGDTTLHKEIDTHHRTPRWTRRIITAAMLVILVVVALWTSLYYVDRMCYEIPHDGDRADVKSVLKLFRETKVSLDDIPVGWREGIDGIPGYDVYRYDFLCCPLFAIHIVYDGHGQVRQIIPTYE